MSEKHPGSTQNVTALREASPRALPPGVIPKMGSTLHREIIDYRIKPGTVAYRRALEALATTAEAPIDVLILTFDGEGLDNDNAWFTISGGTAPYAFDPGDGEDPVEIKNDGTFEYAYAANGTYTVTLGDSGTSQRRQTDTLDVTVDWLAG